ncbi:MULTISPECIES: hypothetical protein [Chryseobacterium]|uniref:hypothetical protein n=1 Tax=Chryseobacterium TaxID=59732 RepID=UPI001296322B|nr:MULTISPECIES: hypothetical protein [Chryseobacterium]MDR6921208.1 hypothetical protein [Chryseobacterium sp. 2987]
MKSIYITLFLLIGAGIYAQENKQVSQTEDQTLALKQIKEFESKMMKEAQLNAEKKTPQTALVSEQGLEVKKQEQKPKATSGNSGTMLPNTASLDEIKRSIPNRQASRSTAVKTQNARNQTGLSNTATLAEIKKTIPKN